MLSSYPILINAITNGVRKIPCFQHNVTDIKPYDCTYQAWLGTTCDPQGPIIAHWLPWGIMVYLYQTIVQFCNFYFIFGKAVGFSMLFFYLALLKSLDRAWKHWSRESELEMQSFYMHMQEQGSKYCGIPVAPCGDPIWYRPGTIRIFKVKPLT